MNVEKHEKRERLDCLYCAYGRFIGGKFVCIANECEAEKIGYDATKLYPFDEDGISERGRYDKATGLANKEIVYGKRVRCFLDKVYGG